MGKWTGPFPYYQKEFLNYGKNVDSEREMEWQ